jgi:DNA-binding CsgD family transcriptional regulator
MATDATLDEYRTGYVSERYDVSDNCARALQLFELGYTCSAIARGLDVTVGTVRSYKAQLQSRINPDVILTVSSADGRNKAFDTWGERDEISGSTYEQGVEDARARKNDVHQATTEEMVREEVTSLNRGASLEEIPNELIHISW